ncbi:MAG: acyl-CoA dehydrogenase family protein [Dehalococcoidia bacterium]
MRLFDSIGPRQPFSDQEQMLVGAVRRLARDRFAHRAAAFDRSGDFPWPNIEDLNTLELNRALLPPEHGGVEISYACYLTLVKEISMACASTGIIWATNFHASKPIVDAGNEQQKQRFLSIIARGGLGALAITEPSGGSDAATMETTFRPDGEAIVINGSKAFITNGDVADLYLVFGRWTEIDDPRRALSALVLPRGVPGLIIGRKEEKLGHRASSTVALAFDDCRVPRANLLGAPGDGRQILLRALNTSRPSVAAQALGIARAAFEDAVTAINQPRRSGQRVVDFQGIQFMVADMAASLALAENWMFHVADLVEAGASDFSVEAAVLKLVASDLAMEIATNAVQLLGGAGYCADHRAERLFREAKVTQIWEGTNQIQRAYIGRAFATSKPGGRP